jgi:hypothetical protein
MRRRFGPRRFAGFVTLAFAVSAALVFLTSGAFAGGNAGYTTFDATVQGCLDSPNGVDCNNYSAKEDVYTNGGPSGGKGLAEGDYFFAVLVPGFQNGGFLDGADGNLSDTTPSFDDHGNPLFQGAGGGDPVACRTFHVSGGLITSYAPGTACTDLYAVHATGTSTVQTGEKPLIALSPYDNTTNGGGVYIMAICPTSVLSDPNANSAPCKFDAFRIAGGEVTPAADLDASKTAVPDFTRDFTWSITKSACAHGITPCRQTVSQTGGSVTFDYVVTVTKSGANDSGWEVGGDITVTNPNSNTGDVMNIAVTDSIDNGGTCDVGNSGTDTQDLGTLSRGASASVSYVCTFSSNPVSGTNTVHVVWNPNLSDGSVTPNSSVDKTADYTFGDPTTVNGNCITVTDTFNNTLSTLSPPGGDCATTPHGYSHTINVTAGCHGYINTATFSGANVTTNLKQSDSQTVTVCGPLNTSALTIGFWKNANGNTLIQYYCAPSGGKQSLATYLSSLGAPSGPFSGAAGKSCSQLVTFANGILAGASATDMNVMLKAQMLGTALDVYFSDPNKGYTSTTISGKKPPSSFLTNGSLGGLNIDLTLICPMIDNTTAGTASCKNNTPSTNGFASGAFLSACLTVQGILDYESTVPSPYNGYPFVALTTKSIWYGGDRTKEEIAKNTFDQINNRAAFGC